MNVAAHETVGQIDAADIVLVDLRHARRYKLAALQMLQDLIITAVNEAMRQMEEISENEMNKVTGGLGIPGL